MNDEVKEKYEKIHENVHANATPEQKAIMDEATRAMSEVEQIFNGPISDENVQFVKQWLSRAGVIIGDFEDEKALKLSKQIKALELGQYLIIEGRAFVKTGDQKIQEARAYIYRLEQTAIRLMDDRDCALVREKEAKGELSSARFLVSEYELLLSRGFFGKLKFAIFGK